MLDHLDALKRALPVVLVVLAAVLVLAIVIGGLFFNLEIAQILSWFCFIIMLVFALAFIYAVVSFIGWFLFSSPYVAAFVAGAVVVILLAALIFIKLVGGPVVDLESMLEPIFSFLK